MENEIKLLWEFVSTIALACDGDLSHIYDDNDLFTMMGQEAHRLLNNKRANPSFDQEDRNGADR